VVGSANSTHIFGPSLVFISPVVIVENKYFHNLLAARKVPEK
jgi:hypothetical protein